MASINIQDGFVIEGIADMNRRILNILRATAEETEQAAVRVAEKKILAPAIEYCPIDTGALRESGKVGQPERVGYEVHVPVTFGGDSVDYAAVVHEDLEVHHPVGQAKFLERAMNEEEPRYAADLAAEVRLERLG